MSDDPARKQFAADVLALSIAFGVKDRMDGTRLSLYWQALKDIPAPILHGAAERCLRACDRFPAIAEWRRACDDVNREQLFQEELPPARQIEGQVAVVETPWEDQTRRYFACETCKDTGFAPWICTEDARCGCTKGNCQRRPAEYRHQYVTKCVCRETNPVLIREREETARRVRAQRYGRTIERPADRWGRS